MADASPVSGPSRLLSLDVFRGMTVAGMILVNNPGTWAHVYPPLRHAEWHGWTPTDLIFPFFLFIVGVAVPFSRRTTPAAALRRSAILFALGHPGITGALAMAGLFVSTAVSVFGLGGNRGAAGPGTA